MGGCSAHSSVKAGKIRVTTDTYLVSHLKSETTFCCTLQSCQVVPNVPSPKTLVDDNVLQVKYGYEAPVDKQGYIGEASVGL